MEVLAELQKLPGREILQKREVRREGNFAGTFFNPTYFVAVGLGDGVGGVA